MAGTGACSAARRGRCASALRRLHRLLYVGLLGAAATDGRAGTRGDSSRAAGARAWLRAGATDDASPDRRPLPDAAVRKLFDLRPAPADLPRLRLPHLRGRRPRCRRRGQGGDQSARSRLAFQLRISGAGTRARGGSRSRAFHPRSSGRVRRPGHPGADLHDGHRGAGDQESCENSIVYDARRADHASAGDARCSRTSRTAGPSRRRRCSCRAPAARGSCHDGG